MRLKDLLDVCCGDPVLRLIDNDTNGWICDITVSMIENLLSFYANHYVHEIELSTHYNSKGVASGPLMVVYISNRES